MSGSRGAAELDLRVNDKYKLGKKIGSGSFGDIYEGTDVVTEEKVAIKLEMHRTRHPQLLYEAKLYRILAGGKGTIFLKNFKFATIQHQISTFSMNFMSQSRPKSGIPNSHWYGVEGDYNVLVKETFRVTKTPKIASKFLEFVPK